MTEFLMGVVVRLIGLCLGAFALPVATWFVVNWVRLYTWRLPARIRDRRRREIASDLFEQCRDDLASGFKPEEISARILARWLLGLPTDAAWCIGQWRNSLRRPREYILVVHPTIVDWLINERKVSVVGNVEPGRDVVYALRTDQHRKGLDGSILTTYPPDWWPTNIPHGLIGPWFEDDKDDSQSQPDLGTEGEGTR
jgi:hypothetical protein